MKPEAEARPRRLKILSRRDRGLEAASRPRRRDRGHIPMRKGPLPPLDHLENYQEIPEKWLNVGSLLGVKKLEVFQLQGASPPDPLTRGSAPGPRWGLRPQIPAIGSRSRVRHPAPLCLIPGSAPEITSIFTRMMHSWSSYNRPTH